MPEPGMLVPPLPLPLFPTQIYTAIDNDFNNKGDELSNRATKPGASAGESDNETYNAVSRLIAKFELPMGSDSLLRRATLRFFLEDLIGMPGGALSVFHSVAATKAVHKSDYENESYADTELDLVMPTNSGQAYYQVDVTEFVRRDYAADGSRPISAFRLQMDEAAFVEDDQAHRYVFTMPGAEENHPELVLTYVPEPTTFTLCAVSSLHMLVLRWRRGMEAARSQGRFQGNECGSPSTRAFLR